MKKLLLFLALAAAGLQGRATDYYLVGGATIGWTDNALNRTPARATQTGDNSYAWAGKIKAFDANNDDATRFKIPQGGNYDYGIWASETNQRLTESPSTITYANDGDKKFCVTEEGYYLVSFNTSTHQITAKKLTEPSKDGNYYLISNTNDYYWFAGYIASDATKNAKARLTADISFQDKDFVCLASEKYKFSGEFDGGGHTIDYAITKCSYGNVGLFTFIEQGANIHDLVIGSNSSFWGTQNVGGIAGNAYGSGTVTLRNVINCAEVHAHNDGNGTNSAGFVAFADGATVNVTNCANLGHTSTNGSSAYSAAFVGWIETSATFTNCWNGDAISDMDNNQNLYRKKNEATCTLTNCYDVSGVNTHAQGTNLGTDTKGSGELCHKLNNNVDKGTNWYQNLSGTKDDFPLPFNTQSKVSKSNTSYTNLTVSGGNVQIGTANDLKTFAAEVAAGQTTLNAELTTDINYSASAYQGQDAMIGNGTYKYAGTFDGKNKTITVGFNNKASNETAMFRRVSGATIQNLKVDGNISTEKSFAAGICSCVDGSGTIQNCESAVTISDNSSDSDATHGGILAYITNTTGTGAQVLNCLFSGTIDAPNRYGCGGVVGWTDKNSTNKVKNCLVTGTLNLKKNSNNEVIVRYETTAPDASNNYYTCSATNLNTYAGTEASVKKGTGELCYKLNPSSINWYQTIGTDDYPIPFNTSQQVYEVVADESYTNFATANINSTTHAVKIGTSAQLEKFSKEVNAGNNAMNAELTADITGVTSHTPIGTEAYKYKGTFDGDGKSITFDINTNQDCQALVGHATGDITIKNLILKGSVTSTGSKTAGFIAEAKGGGNITITNCGNEATITGAGGEIAAIIANNYGASCVLKLTNVYNTGSVTKTTSDANGVAAICAYCGVNFSVFKNVYNTGNVTGGSETSAALFVRNPATDNDFNHCYTKYRRDADDSDVTLIISSDVTSGKLCYKLNNETSDWKQTIGTDDYPKPFGATGVVNQVVADKSYSNLTPDDGKVQIGTAANLTKFAKEVNAGNVETDALLTANIVADAQFVPIGNQTYKYKGTFDGGDQKITLSIDTTDPYQGLFGVATGGAKFKNLIIKGNVNGGNNTAALVGQIGGEGESGTITINRVGCEVNVSGSYEHHGAFVGNDWGGSVKLEVENCYNIGDISGSATYTSVMGSWVDPNSSYTNVFNSGTITGNKFSHQNRGNCTNCYTTTSGAGEVSNLVQGVTSDQITSGKLCYLLNGNTQGGTDWRQTLSGSVDAHPVFFSDHKKVYQYNSTTYVNDGDKVTISNITDLNNFAAVVNSGATSLNAELTDDIATYSGSYIGDASEHNYIGTFDGKTHKITINFDNSSENQIGLFKYINTGCTIQNLIVDGKIVGNKFMGGLINLSYGNPTIQNVIVGVNMSSSFEGDGTHGGVISVAQSGSAPTIRNVAFVGSIDAENSYGSCGIIGYAHNGGSITYQNCYVAGTLNLDLTSNNNSRVFGRNGESCNNCYTNINKDEVEWLNNDDRFTNGGLISNDEIKSGKLCYNLGHGGSEATWTQTIGTDDYPIPFDTQRTVYRYGESDPYWYSNLNNTGTVNISSAKDLTDFSSLVNAGNASLNAELTNDIDMSDVTYTPIGTNSYNYAGTFDGKGFRITHLNINNDLAEQGLFSVCAGATIQNLILDSTCSIKTTNTTYGNAAFVAAVKGSSGTLTFQNCGNEATVIGKKNTAAFVGANKSSNNINISLTNCYNSGTIGDDTNGDEDAVIVAWNDGATLTVTNFYNCGTIKHVEGESRKRTLGRGNGSWNYSKCYNILSDSQYSGKTNNYDINKVYSGELCVTLDSPFTQDLSQEEGHPTFGSKEVLTGQWFNDSEDDVYYNQDGDDYTVYQLNLDDSKTKYALPDGANVTAKHVSVARSITAGKWVGLCLPFDYDNPSGWDVRELTNVNGTGDEECMIFTAASSIVAGKPYLVKVTGDDVSTISATDKTIVAAAQTVEESDVNMVGRFKKASINVGDYYITTDNKLKKLTGSSVDMKGFRAYFTLDGSSVKALSFDIEDDADGIESIQNSKFKIQNNEPIYNLAGQRIQKMQKGINIVNGRKVLK